MAEPNGDTTRISSALLNRLIEAIEDGGREGATIHAELAQLRAELSEHRDEIEASVEEVRKCLNVMRSWINGTPDKVGIVEQIRRHDLWLKAVTGAIILLAGALGLKVGGVWPF
jgi:hypothetical protein